ncbi:hypothetical protein HIM_03222 [Hirsutella minnesotensis 3608]|nr:hypothetical protein HIM_03222 [Hirsutella minnesotensis 3608]
MQNGTVERITGDLACQRDPYLRTLEAEVISCEESPTSEDGTSTGKTWQIVFSDSVLFPEGGGQPCDHGSISLLPSQPSSKPIQITKVERKGSRCTVISPTPLSVGDKVLQQLDFPRRWHHMQQHTGQHLLSAIARKGHDLETLGWGMGTEDSPNYIDIPRKPTQHEMDAIQDTCNRAIRDNLPIAVQYADKDEESISDQGKVRFMSIGGLDRNRCCGTHLSQTSHLSVILLLYSQPVNSRRHRLYFVAGDRAIAHATRSIHTLMALGKQLSCSTNPKDMIACAETLQQTAKENKKNEKKLLAEIARLEVARVKPLLRLGRRAWIYQAQGGMDFMNAIKAEMRDVVVDDNGPLLVATGDIDKPGHVWIFHREAEMQALTTEVGAVLPEVKGGGRGNLWQGKVPRWRRQELKSLQELAEAP